MSRASNLSDTVSRGYMPRSVLWCKRNETPVLHMKLTALVQVGLPSPGLRFYCIYVLVFAVGT